MEPRDRALEEALTQRVSPLAPAVYAFREIGSTMDVAQTLAAQGAPDGTLVWADRQHRGRGRLGRVWQSPIGGIYLSVLVRPAKPAGEVPQLSLVAGLSCAEAIHEVTGLSPGIRWPNDVLIHGQKVAGILVEASTSEGQGSRNKVQARAPGTLSLAPCTSIFAIVGIGINVTTDPRGLPEGAGSLATAGASCNPYELTGRLYGRFRSWCDRWASEGFEPIRTALRPWIGLFGQVVHLSAGAMELEGTATDLDEAGRLLVRLDSGLVRAVEMGEVALLRARP